MSSRDESSPLPPPSPPLLSYFSVPATAHIYTNIGDWIGNTAPKIKQRLKFSTSVAQALGILPEQVVVLDVHSPHTTLDFEVRLSENQVLDQLAANQYILVRYNAVYSAVLEYNDAITPPDFDITYHPPSSPPPSPPPLPPPSPDANAGLATVPTENPLDPRANLLARIIGGSLAALAILLFCLWYRRDKIRSLREARRMARAARRQRRRQLDEMSEYDDNSSMGTADFGNDTYGTGSIVTNEADIQFDVYVAHSWGQGNVTHKRVEQVVQHLRGHGLRVWFDETRIESDVYDEVTEGIDQARIVLVCISQQFVAKMRQDEDSINKLQVNYARGRKRQDRFLPAIMEARMRDRSRWAGPVAELLGDTPAVDLADGRMPTDQALQQVETLIRAQLATLDKEAAARTVEVPPQSGVMSGLNSIISYAAWAMRGNTGGSASAHPAFALNHPVHEGPIGRGGPGRKRRNLPSELSDSFEGDSYDAESSYLEGEAQFPRAESTLTGATGDDRSGSVTGVGQGNAGLRQGSAVGGAGGGAGVLGWLGLATSSSSVRGAGSDVEDSASVARGAATSCSRRQGHVGAEASAMEAGGGDGGFMATIFGRGTSAPAVGEPAETLAPRRAVPEDSIFAPMSEDIIADDTGPARPARR
mmetsp:Transcript_20552/g.55349  ORF Transcript_20552/g.55349 Transcript_20552/m.55349 type:complete len:646 (+) Transcript_20552:276-2213(+)